MVKLKEVLSVCQGSQPIRLFYEGESIEGTPNDESVIKFSDKEISVLASSKKNYLAFILK